MNIIEEPAEFQRRFRQIPPEEIPGDVFTLVGKIYPVVTVGAPARCNAMVASGGGMGMMFRKPAVWCIFPSNRYTLELIERERVYTLSYFPESCREQYMAFGMQSGRDSDKMARSRLTALAAPGGGTSFAEARLVIACELTQITTVPAGDFYSGQAKAYLAQAYTDPGEIRKYVFGEITHVWVKKEEGIA